jgi:hypothetical protein
MPPANSRASQNTFRLHDGSSQKNSRTLTTGRDGLAATAVSDRRRIPAMDPRRRDLTLRATRHLSNSSSMNQQAVFAELNSTYINPRKVREENVRIVHIRQTI